MSEFNFTVTRYLKFCRCQKNLSEKTVKAYRIDLKQYYLFSGNSEDILNKPAIMAFVAYLHTKYKPKSVKRKIASLKAFCSYLEEENEIEVNPFLKIKLNYKEPFLLPKVVSLDKIQRLFSTMYSAIGKCATDYMRSCTLRNIAVIELLFATGMRVSELCALTIYDIDFINKTVRIYGKGARERILQIENRDVIKSLLEYYKANKEKINDCRHFFVNKLGNKLSEQSVRCILRKYTKQAEIDMHITPHMLRHSFATLLLEEDVDIRYIQHMLGHSSITTTQIYTHVATAKQKQILLTKHPRNKLFLGEGQVNEG